MPPLVAGAVQVKVIEVAVLAATVSVRPVGTSAYVRICAPLPASEVSESPFPL